MKYNRGSTRSRREAGVRSHPSRAQRGAGILEAFHLLQSILAEVSGLPREPPAGGGPRSSRPSHDDQAYHLERNDRHRERILIPTARTDESLELDHRGLQSREIKSGATGPSGMADFTQLGPDVAAMMITNEHAGHLRAEYRGDQSPPRSRRPPLHGRAAWRTHPPDRPARRLRGDVALQPPQDVLDAHGGGGRAPDRSRSAQARALPARAEDRQDPGQPVQGCPGHPRSIGKVRSFRELRASSSAPRHPRPRPGRLRAVSRRRPQRELHPPGCRTPTSLRHPSMRGGLLGEETEAFDVGPRYRGGTSTWASPRRSTRSSWRRP